MKRHLILFLLMLILPLAISAQETVTVTGTVTDEFGPLPGVNIVVKNVPGLGTITDSNGKYSIKMEPFNRLIFSYIGYETQEVLVKEQRVVNLKMEISESNQLEEVVVLGMGAQKKISVTGSVTNVNVGELQRLSTTNLSSALAGQVPGIITQQTSGQPGKNTSEFWIRGISTFGASSGAYILVDGFERSSLDEISIEDIATFTVLKDASATAIYGSKGANGVVLITTKRGNAGKIKVDVKVETAYNARTITPEFVDGITYAQLSNEAQITRNLGQVYRPEEIELIRTQADPSLYPNVDWMDILLKDGAWRTNANLNLSGGGNTARYYISASYLQEEGMYKTDKTLRDQYDSNANFNRWNYRMNLDVDITKTTLLKLGIGGSLDKQNEPGVSGGDIWGALFGFNSLSSPLTIEENGVEYAPALGGGDGRINPWTAATQMGYGEKWNNNIQVNVTLEQDLKALLKGLKFTGRFGFSTDNHTEIKRRARPALYKANGRNQETGLLNLEKVQDYEDMKQSSSSSGNRREFLDLMLNWGRGFNGHNLGATVRYTQDIKKQTVDLGSDIKNGIAFHNQALAGQATYNWNYRYFLDFNFGYSGSENFADGHRYGFFPAFSLAWNVAEEPFIRKNVKWLNMFKLRYSQGKVGNDNLGRDNRFPYLYTITDGHGGYNFGFSANGDSYNGVRYSQVASMGVTWEVATKKDFGIDLTMFNEKFSLTLDYFHEKRTGIYMSRDFLPESAGIRSNPKANVGAVRSEGFDGHFSLKHNFNKVGVTLRGNITYAKNEVLERDEIWQVYPYQYAKGYRVDQPKGLVSLGLFKDYDDIRNSPKQTFGAVQPGDIKYADVNGDGIVNGDDRVAIGSTSRPNMGYGIGASINYKNFDFNFHFQGAGKSTFRIYGKNVFAFNEKNWGNIFKDMIDDRYIDAETAAKLGIEANENPNASYPRLTYGENKNNSQESTFWMRDGRYIRLKNMDLGYTLPQAFVNRMHLNSVRIYVAGSNLFTWSKFKTWDPESTNPRGEDYPLTKSITLGLTIKL